MRNDVVANAKRCSNCKAYQGFRRYLDFGQVTLALLIALLALLTTIPASMLSIRDYVRELRAPLLFSRVLSVNNDQLSLFVENNSGEELLLSEVSCAVYFPKSPNYAWRRKLAAGTLEDPYLWPTGADVLNWMILTYTTQLSFVEPGQPEIANFDFKSAIVASNRPEPAQEAPSVCMVNFSKSADDNKIELVGLENGFSRDFDILSLLEPVEIPAFLNVTRDELLIDAREYNSE